MDVNGVLTTVRENDRTIFVTVYSEDLEVPFVLPSVKEAKRYAFLLSVAADVVARSQIYLNIFETHCCDKGLLEESEDFEMPAGIIETTAKLIMWLSGYGDEPLEFTQNLIEESRRESEKLFNVMTRTICSVFKAYTIKEAEALDFQELITAFVQAEKVLLEAGIIKEEYKIQGLKDDKPQGQLNVDDEIRHTMRGLAEVDGPPDMRRLQKGERPPTVRRRR